MQWEYRRIVNDGEFHRYIAWVKQAGLEGWELVTVLPENSNKYETSVFKRPVHPGKSESEENNEQTFKPSTT